MNERQVQGMGRSYCDACREGRRATFGRAGRSRRSRADRCRSREELAPAV